MKYLAILTLAAVAFGLGACSNRDDTSHTQSTTHSTGSTTYSK